MFVAYAAFIAAGLAFCIALGVAAHRGEVTVEEVATPGARTPLHHQQRAARGQRIHRGRVRRGE